jgi:arsenical pump membrane protein
MEFSSNTMIWAIAALSTGGVILQPFKLPEAIWAVAGAALLLALQLITPEEALSGAVKGIDVYLFLTGMMLLAEIAREEGLFDWLAAVATSKAKGSPGRLFLLTYGVGALVTIFLSNDATAVVLTPAVAAAVKTAEADSPLPYLLICAFVANAASFVLPISNPANLVIYGHHMPPLLEWLPAYLLPSTASIVATYVVLRWTQRNELTQRLAKDVPVPKLSGAIGLDGSPAEMVDVEAKELATKQMAQLEARKAAKRATEIARAAVVKPKPAQTRPTETPEQLRNRVRAGLLRRRA